MCKLEEVFLEKANVLLLFLPSLFLPKPSISEQPLSFSNGCRVVCEMGI